MNLEKALLMEAKISIADGETLEALYPRFHKETSPPFLAIVFSVGELMAISFAVTLGKSKKSLNKWKEIRFISPCCWRLWAVKRHDKEIVIICNKCHRRPISDLSVHSVADGTSAFEIYDYAFQFADLDPLICTLLASLLESRIEEFRSLLEPLAEAIESEAEALPIFEKLASMSSVSLSKSILTTIEENKHDTPK